MLHSLPGKHLFKLDWTTSVGTFVSEQIILLHTIYHLHNFQLRKFRPAAIMTFGALAAPKKFPRVLATLLLVCFKRRSLGHSFQKARGDAFYSCSWKHLYGWQQKLYILTHLHKQKMCLIFTDSGQEWLSICQGPQARNVSRYNWKFSVNLPLPSKGTGAVRNATHLHSVEGLPLILPGPVSWLEWAVGENWDGKWHCTKTLSAEKQKLTSPHCGDILGIQQISIVKA